MLVSNEERLVKKGSQEEWWMTSMHKLRFWLGVEHVNIIKLDCEECECRFELSLINVTYFINSLHSQDTFCWRSPIFCRMWISWVLKHMCRRHGWQLVSICTTLGCTLLYLKRRGFVWNGHKCLAVRSVTKSKDASMTCLDSRAVTNPGLGIQMLFWATAAMTFCGKDTEDNFFRIKQGCRFSLILARCCFVPWR